MLTVALKYRSVDKHERTIQPIPRMNLSLPPFALSLSAFAVSIRYNMSWDSKIAFPALAQVYLATISVMFLSISQC